MSESKNKEIMLQKLAEGIDSTSRLTTALLDEIRDSEADFSAVKTELSILRENVKGLSSIVQEGNGATSLITQMALIQQKIENIDKWVEGHVQKHRAIKVSYESVEDQIREIDQRLAQVETFITEQINEKKLREKELRESIHKEQEIQHIKTVSIENTKAERFRFKVALIATIIVGTVAAIATAISGLL